MASLFAATPMASLFAATSLLVALLVSAPNTGAVAPSPQVVDGGISSMAQEMQRARYFTFVMLIRMVQDKIPGNTTFLMPNDRLLSTAPVLENQVLELLLSHSIPATLMFSDLMRLPNGTVVPTHHSSQMITITSREHQKLYFNNIELTNPDVCRGGDLFKCHGINGVIRPTAQQRGQGAACPHYTAPAPAAPEPTPASNQSLETSSLTTPSMGSPTSPALEPAENPQSSHTSASGSGLSCTTLIIVLMFSILLIHRQILAQ